MLRRTLGAVADHQSETAATRIHGREADAPLAGHPLLDLQRAFGNRHVQRVVERARRTAESTAVIQPKLIVGPSDDRYEREADRIADKVIGRRGPAPPASDAAPAGEVDLR